jgi:tripartite-type tricarboxylate transporter receptor subunit TctC
MDVRRAFAASILVVISGAPLPAETIAQTYPAKPVRVVVPFPPGGAADIVARAITQELGKAWGMQVIVDNRAGAGGLIGAEHAARAAPDGYTLLFASASPMTVSPHLASKPPYHPLRDFTPIVLIGFAPNVIVVHPSLPARSMKELIALAKARPGQINYASNGVGTLSHLAMELVKHQAGIDLVHVPYKGGAPAMIDMLAGRIDLYFSNTAVAMPHVKSGRIKMLAVTSAKRQAAVENVPTFAESGVPGYEVTSWFGLFAPAKTPADVITRLHAEVARIVALPDTVKHLDNAGLTAASSTPAELGAFVRREIEKWTKVVKAAGIKAD